MPIASPSMPVIPAISSTAKRMRARPSHTGNERAPHHHLPGIASRFCLLAICGLSLSALGPEMTLAQVWGSSVDVSDHFRDFGSTYFVGSRLVDFDPATGAGTMQWDRHRLQPGQSFNKADLGFARAESNEFPGTEYARDPQLPFRIDFISPRAVRLRFSTRSMPIEETPSLMLDGAPEVDDSWEVHEDEAGYRFRSAVGELILTRDPWRIELRDAEGNLVTRTRGLGEPATYSVVTPFSFVRRVEDMGRSTAAAFELHHDEKLFGGGESFTRFDKRGQKIDFFIQDGMGAQTEKMYKPIPFFLSSRGYGMFVHTSAPVTIDFGEDFDESAIIYSGDEIMDLFVFLGEPKEVVSEYTAITGRSPVPPLWSFGLWMSRITYDSEAQVRDVASKLRRYRIPADVLHIDTGWFETDWRSDYRFSETRFPNPVGMIRDLREMNLRVSLWQLPYFTRENSLFNEIVGAGLHVRNEGGRLPELDATLDFSNPETIQWYRGRLQTLLDMGVSVIKADFGEGAPLRGLYASGRSGWYEHNLYPLRYNQVVWDVTREATGDGIIWGRSAWAGSQRYPLHWGGDAENTNSAMAATLRAGLSMGLSGFSFWSHDIGGFVQRPSRDLYARWLPFGALTSHTRTHGAPPREPWEWDDAMVEEFQRAIGLKYALMPYIWAQALRASELGHPLMRPLFFEYPDDPASWLIEDQYLFGSDLLVAPLFESDARSRTVYLPPGEWVDYQTERAYRGGAWHEIPAGGIPIVLLARGGSAIPLAGPAQSTAELDWTDIEIRVFGDGPSTGWFATPESAPVELRVTDGHVEGNPLPDAGIVWRVRR